MTKKRKTGIFDHLFDKPYFKCVFQKHPELLKTGPQSKFFNRVKGPRPERMSMADGPIFECRECGCRYIYTILKSDTGKKEGVMYTPVGQHDRPKWMDDMPEGADICSGGTLEVALVWKKGVEPKWDITAKMYVSWIGGKGKSGARC